MIISQKTFERLQFILNAKLSKEELEEVTDYAKHLKAKRMNKGKGGGERNPVNVYDETDKDGVLKETFSECI